MTLRQFFREHPKVALAFSGGVDSSYLLYAAGAFGADVAAYFAKTAFQPELEWDDARTFAASVGARLRTVEADILADPAVTRNDVERCYHCKLALFGRLRDIAAADGYPVLIDGTNASDDAAERPGMRALAELGVISPLRACGLSKDDVRELSRKAGLLTWDKPSYSCLATRVEAGCEITAARLKRIERAEALLFALGFGNFRVRLDGERARIELPAAQMERLLAERERILEGFRDFAMVSLDLRAR